MKITPEELARMREEDEREASSSFGKVMALATDGNPDFIDAFQSHLYRFCNSTSRPNAVLDLVGRVTGEQFWPIVHEAWTSFDAIDHRSFSNAFLQYEDSWQREYLETADRAFFASLPNVVTAYRGQPGDCCVGLSWTLNETTAAEFARGHRGLFNSNPSIFTARINKCDIAGAYTSRNEAEIVLFDADNADIIDIRHISVAA